MKVWKKIGIILIVVGFILGSNLVMNHSNGNNYVCAATSAPTPTPTPSATPTPYIKIIYNIEKISDAAEQGPRTGQFHVWSTQSGTITADGWTKVAYTISGTATNGVDYQTISGYVYILVGFPIIPAPTDAPNTYIDIKPITEYHIEGPETVTLTLQNVTVGSGSATMIIEDFPEVVPTPTPNPNAPVEVRGYVYDKNTNLPIAGATVQMDTAGTATDANGFYSISQVILPRPASVPIAVSATGYQTQTVYVTVPVSGVAYQNVYMAPLLTPTATVTATAIKTATPVRTVTPRRTATPRRTVTPRRTATPRVTATPTPTPVPTATPVITVTPTATLGTYTLSVAIVMPADGSSSGSPSLTVNPPGTTVVAPTTFTYQPGTVVTITANSNGFSRWSGSVTGNQNPATVTMDGNKTVYAVYDSPGGFKLQMYNVDRSATTNTVNPSFRVINPGTAPLVLSTVKIRYYFTANGNVPQNFYCDYSQVGSSNVFGTFVTLATPKVGADCYLEIGFTSGAGTLAPGASIDIQTRIAKSDWTNYTQTDDYSFNATATTYVDWTKITGYVSGTLNWGVEP